MKVRQGGVPGVPCQVKGQETITLVPHAPCHGDPEEELVTITMQATPPTGRQGLNRMVVHALPGILVTDISTSASSDATLPLVPASDSTISCVPHAPAKAPAALPRPRGVATKLRRHMRARGTAPTHTSSSRPASVMASLVKQGVGVLGDCKSGQCSIDKPHTLNCESKTTLTPSPHPTTPAHHLTTRPSDVVNTCHDVVLATPSTTCSFCRSVSDGENTFTSLNLKAPLPHTMLEPISLLQCLGVTPPAGATPTDGAVLATLCQECHTLVCESDHAYHHLMEVMVGMKQRWAGLKDRIPPVPTTLQETNKEQQEVVVATPVSTQCAKKLRPILPKPSGPVLCGLCGAHLATLEEWHQHTVTHHRLSPRWRSPRLQAILKVCLTKQLQQDNGQHDTRRCPACSRSFSQHEKFLEHLQDHHRVKVDKDFLACIDGGTEGVGRGTVRQRKDDNLLGKEDVVKKEQVLEEEKEIVEDEMIEEKERMVKNEEHEREEEEEMEEKMEEEIELRSRENSLLEEHQTESGSEECTKESGVRNMDMRQEQDDSGRGRGSRWRCRMCAAVFTSQQDHDTHKAATHPDTVRARRGTTRPSVPQELGKKDGAHQDLEYPVVAYQEGAIVILEGDGHGGVIHHRLQPTNTPEDPQDKAQQNTPSQTGAALSFPCPACTEVFGDPLSLVRHQRAAHSHTGLGDGVVLVECPVCDHRLAGTPALRHHMARVHRRSHPSLRHRCRLCLCQCHTRSQLERHMRERHGAPPLPPPVQCGQCGKTYSARYIESHLANMHGDVARFPCAFCPMKFRAKTSLQGHVSLEHANTSWTCQKCPLQFTKYHQLRQHYLYVHSQAEHRCPQCPRSFKRRSDLTEHTKRRHLERQPQGCSFCPKGYSDRKRLRIHLMRKHNVAWEDTLAQGYARRQRENNCLRRRQQQQQQQPPHSPQEKDHHNPKEEGEESHGDMLGAQPDYNVVHLTEAPHPLADSISYIILEEGMSET